MGGSQRYLLRQIIADADSSIRLPYPSAQLRYGHETVLLPLVCLIGINGYDLETDDLEKLEAKGWWCSDVFPMGSNVQFIFYRSGPNDNDILFKVLLNEKEAKLPIRTDCRRLQEIARTIKKPRQFLAGLLYLGCSSAYSFTASKQGQSRSWLRSR